jgi:hypothetical protein
MARKPPVITARNADRYRLYLDSVQDPEHEIHILRRVYKDAFGKDPRTLREDFCGTAAICANWTEKGADKEAWGIDLDPEPLAWGALHNVSKLRPHQKSRVHLVEADVRSKAKHPVDVVAAQNFSFQIFKEREVLRDYFRHAYANLDTNGVFLLDMMGGPLCMEDNRVERRRCRGFTYIWEQEYYDPITHHTQFYIHFEFKDGTRLKRAFSYHWRMWTMAEVTELLTDAGFSAVEVYWMEDETTANGEPIYRRRKHGPADQCWLTYVVGVKRGRASKKPRA